VADVSVRPARPEDAVEIARIQIETWRTGYAKVLPAEVLDALAETDVARQWRGSISTPPSSEHRVLIANEGEWPVGFTAFGPDPDVQEGDPDAEHTASINLILVEPRWGRRGHGSRLLAAVADLSRDAGMTRLVTWVPVAQTPTLEFFRGAGWDADGFQRTLDTGAGTINELRLHTSLAQD